MNRIYPLDRGYERMEEKLRKLGAGVERLSEKEHEQDREVELAQG